MGGPSLNSMQKKFQFHILINALGSFELALLQSPVQAHVQSRSSQSQSENLWDSENNNKDLDQGIAL